MRVLVACEESQAVCIAFRRRGHEAYSADLQPCSGGHPEWHIQGDALALLDDGWDLLIAHPPCTYLSHVGARWLYKNGTTQRERFELGMEAKAFFMRFWNASCPRVCVENPLPSPVFALPPPSQKINPWWFGDEAQKLTLLWLRGLRPLVGTNVVGKGEMVTYRSGKRKAKWFMDAAHSTEEERKRIRSKTFPGIAAAMAEQWGTDWRPPELELRG